LQRLRGDDSAGSGAAPNIDDAADSGNARYRERALN